MAITVEQMSRISALAMAGADFEAYVKSANLTGADRDEAEELWDETNRAIDDLEPGQQIMLPNEWS